MPWNHFITLWWPSEHNLMYLSLYNCLQYPVNGTCRLLLWVVLHNERILRDKRNLINVVFVLADLCSRGIRGLFKKYPTFLYKTHNTMNFENFIQSPSKYSPWWCTHFSQRFCHFWKHLLNSTSAMPWSSSVDFFIMSSLDWNRLPFRVSFSLGNSQKSHGAKSGE